MLLVYKNNTYSRSLLISVVETHNENVCIILFIAQTGTANGSCLLDIDI